jgi:hypothetical protein
LPEQIGANGFRPLPIDLKHTARVALLPFHHRDPFDRLLVAQALPLPRLLLGRGDVLDLGLLALRLGTLAGTARAYERADLPYWLSPLADPAAVGRVLWGALRPTRTWRGRTYTG